MADGLLELVPNARVATSAVIGSRDQTPCGIFGEAPGSNGPILYSCRSDAGDRVFGHPRGERLKNAGVAGPRIQLMVLVAAPEGVAELQRAHPDVAIYAAALDQCLDENAYIVPGLGDAGDRLFGTA